MKKKTKSILSLATMALLLIFAISGTIAYLMADTDPVVNTFTPASTSTKVDEEFASNVKNNVKIKNTGDIDAYIRAAVVITWQNSAGQVYAMKPVEGEDYEITWSKNGWTNQATDGFYYHKEPVKPDDSTGVLFTGCEPLKAAPLDGYTLHVEIIGESIQAEPDSVVESAWDVTVGSDKSISK